MADVSESIEPSRHLKRESVKSFEDSNSSGF